MMNTAAFITCIRDNLKERRFGKERADEIVKDFEARTKNYRSLGHDETAAAAMAMKDTFDNISENALEKAKRTAKMLTVQAQNNARIEQGLTANMKLFDVEGKEKSNRGTALARAAISLIEDDPRFNGLAYTTLKETYRGQLFAIMDDVVDKVGKGAFGSQRGKAHLPNIVREIFGEKTQDLAARDMAAAWAKTENLAVDLFNQAGGSMKKLQRYLPQPDMAVAKLVKQGFEAWKKTRADRWDWDRMRWPDGTVIAVEDRDALIKNIYDTLSTDGASKIDDKAFRGKGRAVGNMLDNNRFIHYKNADAWIADLNEFGDANPFEVMVRHMENMAHRTAMVQQFGPNPDMTFANIEAIVKKKAAGLSPQDKASADAMLKNKFRPMTEVITRSNPMDPNSLMGASATALSNILTSAQLGSAALLAIPGDFMQTVAVRALNKMKLFGGMDFYFKSIATDKKFMEQIATQSGFVFDEVVSATYAATRFTGMATVGPAYSRRVSDTIMRASLMSGHTKAARWSAQAEFMGLLQRSAETSFDDLPFVKVMQRYGITKAEWDSVRANVKAFQPKQGVNFLRPIDILNTKLANKDALYRKFQGMVFEESRKMVPESTIEGTVTLKDTSRPDTLVGLLLHSFAMYKNFPISFWMVYGRLGMTSDSVKGRLGFFAGLGAGMTMVGAMGVQMREVAQGRDPMPMNDPKFYGKAFLSGGALSIWGDFLFGGVNQATGGGPTETAAGPLVSWLGDTTQLAFGDTFNWVNSVGGLGTENKLPAKMVEYAKRYTPGSNLWWARLALERQAWDRLQEIADPKAYRKRKQRAAMQKEKYGNEYWWPQGETSPLRAPEYQGRQ
jgi:hypothetical protein